MRAFAESGAQCHKLAEGLGLGHKSRGEGQARRIILWNQPTAK